MEKLFDAEGITSSERYFYTPSSFARKHLCYVQEAGCLKSLKPHASIRENVESFLFFYVREGTGCVRYEGKTYELKKGDAVFLDCREHYEHESSVSSPWELAWVHFDGAKAEAVYPLFKKQNAEQPVFMLGRHEEEAAELIGMLLADKGENSIEAELRSDGVVTRLMLLCLQLAGEKKEAVVFDGIREALNEELGKSAPTIDGIKEALVARYGTDIDSLDAFFNARYGISIEGYAANRMLNKAKELLRFTIKPMQEVIAESGIGSEEKLRSLFMDNENMSPEDYRKKWAQWIKG